MATYNINVSQSSEFFIDNLSGSQSTTFAIANDGPASSYFVLETYPPYSPSSPKCTSGSFTLGSGLSGLIQNDYFASVVVAPGGGNLTFVPAAPITGSNLVIKGMSAGNYYDQYLLDRFRNAAAAYSLRKLNSSYNGSAVRVRRSIDNAEANIGFNPAELDTTTLTNFATNAEAALPADYGNGPEIGYSLRYIESTYSGPVVRVRRDSDNNELNFTPSEITDGTLEAWVNEDVVTYTSNFTSGFDGVLPQKFTGEFNVDGVEGVDDTLKLTLKTGTEEWWSQRPSTFVAGNTYTITLDIYIPSSNTLVDNVRIGSTANGTDIGTVNTVGAWTRATFNFTAVSSILGIRAFDGNSGYFAGNSTDHFYVKNIQVTQTTSNGFVTTWYNQAKDSKHATQSTATYQPKIYDGSTGLVTANGKPALKFSNFQSLTHNWATGSLGATVFDVFATSDTKWILHSNGQLNFPIANQSDSNTAADNADITQWYKNSTLQSISTRGDVYTVYSTGNTVVASYLLTRNLSTRDNISLGNISPGGDWGITGTVQESIWYLGNQTSNRTDIESNINNYYNIFPFDAYVTTWYDQSGNGNHITQTSAASQPTLVSGSSIIQAGNRPALYFDNINDNLIISASNSSNLAMDNHSSVLVHKVGSVWPYTIPSYYSPYERRDPIADGTNYAPFGNATNHSSSFWNGSSQTVSNVGIDLNTSYIWNLIGNTSDLGLLYQNNSLILNTTTKIGTKNLPNNPIFQVGNWTDLNEFVQKYIQELIMWPSIQTANISTINTNVNTYYDIY